MSEEDQLGLFGETEVPVRKVRRTKKKPEPPPPEVRRTRKTKKRPPPSTRVCPTCGGSNFRLSSVKGFLSPPELVTTLVCLGCSSELVERKARPDVCEHGCHLKLPCEKCGRTWESIYVKNG